MEARRLSLCLAAALLPGWLPQAVVGGLFKGMGFIYYLCMLGTSDAPELQESMKNVQSRHTVL